MAITWVQNTKNKCGMGERIYHIEQLYGRESITILHRDEAELCPASKPRSQQVLSIFYWPLNILLVQSPENNLNYEYLPITDY